MLPVMQARLARRRSVRAVIALVSGMILAGCAGGGGTHAAPRPVQSIPRRAPVQSSIEATPDATAIGQELDQIAAQGSQDDTVLTSIDTAERQDASAP